MSTSPWIQVDYSPITTAKARKGDRPSSRLFVAPHQMPKALRAFIDANLGMYVVEIRYPDDEDFRLEASDTGDGCVWVRFGKKSRRLLGLEVHFSDQARTCEPKTESAAVERIESVVRSLATREKAEREKENYRLAMEAIEATKRQLTNELVANQ